MSRSHWRKAVGVQEIHGLGYQCRCTLKHARGRHIFTFIGHRQLPMPNGPIGRERWSWRRIDYNGG